MSKSFIQVSTGLTLTPSREDVVAQYEKYPDQYTPVEDKPTRKPEKAAETK